MMNYFLSIVWDVSPAIFSIGSFEVRWYGLAWALCFVIGMIMFDGFFRREGYPRNLLDSIFLYGVLSTIIGARLGHCFFYDPGYYFSHPWEILYIWEGGLASHGAAIGLLLGLWMFSRKHKLPYIWSLDRIMLPVTLGGALVRLGNLMNSEIYGGPTTLPWGFEFVKDPQWAKPILEGGSGSLPVHPTQIYEALCYLITFAVLAWLCYGRDMGRRRPGLLFGVGLIGVFLSRFFIEFIKNPQEAFENDMALMMGQLLSIPFVIVGIYFVVVSLKRPAVPVPATPAPVYTDTVAPRKKASVQGAVPAKKEAAKPAAQAKPTTKKKPSKK